MANVPLSLALEPVLPSRVPRGGGSTLGHGYRLRLPNGPAVEDDDPLLKAFGAAVDWLEHDDDEPLQLDVFDPGRSLRLTGEPLGDEACVLDAEGIRCAGTIGGDAGAIACAALEHGLPIEALALCEQRDITEDRRCGLRLLVFSPALVELDGCTAEYRRPKRPTRRTLVLFADATGDLRWWDPTASGGPVDVQDLPFSVELATAFADLRESYAEMVGAKVDEGFDRLEHNWTREALEQDARALWLRARIELGRRFAVGYLGPGMQRPVWSAESAEGDDEIPF